MTRQNLKFLLVAAALEQAKGAIQTDSHLWSNPVVTNGIAFINGVPTSSDPSIERRFTAPYALEEDQMSGYASKPNVVRVQSILPQQKFDELFPDRDSLYTYDGFIKAVAKYPMFCGEYNSAATEANLQGLESACKRELSTLLAHFDINSDGLRDVQDSSCAGSTNASCVYDSQQQPYSAVAGQLYYGRGPMAMTGSYNYGQFGDSFGPVIYDQTRFLDNPNLVTQDSYTAFASGLYFYMTPSINGPSMHEIMTGFFSPNAADLNAGFRGGFGSTTFIASGGADCAWSESQASKDRRNTFIEFLTEFGGSSDEQNMDCIKTWADWNYSGSHNLGLNYINQDCNQIVQWKTEFSIFRVDDFKRCLCQKNNAPDECGPADQNESTGDSGQGDNTGDNDQTGGGDSNDDGSNGGTDGSNDQTGGDGSNDQTGGDGSNDQTGGDDSSNDGQTGGSGGDDQNQGDDGQTNDSLIQEMFEQIWSNPHYSQDEESRTLYQVDQQLDLIEQVLIEFQTVMEANGLILVQQ